MVVYCVCIYRITECTRGIIVMKTGLVFLVQKWLIIQWGISHRGVMSSFGIVELKVYEVLPQRRDRVGR